MESTELFLHLAVILGLCAIAGFLMKVLKLPLLIGYLLAGVALASLKFLDIDGSHILDVFPGIGIAFVMFFVGLELDIKELKLVGKPIVVAGLSQVFISSLAGFAIAHFLGFGMIESLLLGIGLSFSSTIVVVKMLMEHQELKSLQGKLCLGVALLEDLIAIIILMALTIGTSFFNLGLQSGLPFLAFFAKGVLLFLTTFIFSHYLLTRVFRAVANSQELLFLTALAWCFVFVGFAVFLGFSVVIGAFLAGVALASSPFHYSIQGKVKPLRDFFVTLFFVYIGSHVIFNDIANVIWLVAAYITYVIIIKPLIFLLVLGAFGFKKHTIFRSAVSMSQVSEFSLVVILVGYQTGVVSQNGLTAMAIIGVITIITSSIEIAFYKPLYKKLVPFIGFFVHGKFSHTIEDRKSISDMADHVIVIGAHRVGGSLVEFFDKKKVPLLVVDFDPHIVQDLIARKINTVYGDIGDPEILDVLNWEKAKIIISSAPNLDDNLMLLSEIKKRKAASVVIVRGESVEDAKTLYDKGADYVILPEIVSGEFLEQLFKDHWGEKGFFKDRSDVELKKLDKPHLAFE